MRVEKRSAPLLLATLLLAAPFAAGSDLYSLCEMAATSANGRYLVVEEDQFKQIDPNTSKVEQMSWQVFSSVEFRRDIPASPGAHWTPDRWSVVLKPPFPMECPWPLIRDNGLFLVLMNGYEPGATALWIYRQSEREVHQGVLVKEIKLGELGPR